VEQPVSGPVKAQTKMFHEEMTMPKLTHCAMLLLSPALLATAGCGTIEEGVAEAVSDTKRAVLTGTEVVGRGDPDGMASAELSISDEADQICYDVNDVRNVGMVTGAAIYRGAKGVNGTVVLRLREANEGGWKNCVKRSEWVESALERSSGAYYIQLMSSEFPNGAVRGQFY
jgi:CHRD domain